MMHLRCAFAVAACCGLAASTAQAQFDNSVWPGFKGTAAKRGAVNAPGPALNLAFRRDAFATVTPGGFTLSAAGDVYFKAYTTSTSKFYRLDPATGNTLATSADFAGNGGNYGGVAVGVDALYACVHNGAPNTSIVKLDKSTLATINQWTNAAFQGLRGTPLIGSVPNSLGHVNLYVADREGVKVHAVDSVTGAVQWSADVLYATFYGQPGPMWTTPEGKQVIGWFGNGNFGPGEAIRDNGDGTFTKLWSLGGPGNFNWWGCGALSADGTRIYVTTFHDPVQPDPNFTNSMWAVSVADGSVIWSGGLPDSNHFGRPAVVGNRVYAGNAGGGVYCYQDDGATFTQPWIYTNADPGEFTSVTAAKTPGGDTYIYALQQEAQLSLGHGRLVVLKDNGATFQVLLDTTLSDTMRFSLNANNGGTIDAQGSLWAAGGRVDDATRGDIYKFVVGGAPCYANCDASTISPILNVNDFTCFLNKYAAGDTYANCDNSTIPPTLNVNDFTCFLNKYAAGCP